jgi:hypothetical protein
MVYTSRPRDAGRQGTKKKEIRSGDGYFDLWCRFLRAHETILNDILKAL